MEYRKLFDYEEGLLCDDEVVALFQTLIDNGLAWELQGGYGRMARRLIEDGRCTCPLGALAKARGN